MQNIQKTRFLAANYSNLQGLKSVPLGMLLVLVVIWTNAHASRVSDLILPVLLTVFMFALFVAIRRYYLAHFGKTDRTESQKRVELVLGALGGFAGLAAYALDIRFHLPVSLVGLAFALAVMGDYLRMQWYAPGHYLLPLSLLSFAVLLVVSALPLLGAGQWWLQLGLRSQLLGVLSVAGLVIIINGLLGHWFFVNQLPGREE